MKWFSSPTPKPAPTLEEPSEHYTGAHTSRALGLIFQQCRPERKYHILDLGPAVKENVEFYSRLSCKIYIEDLYQTLNSYDVLAPEDGLPYQALFEYLLPYQTDTRFDIILSWDLFNYLERAEFQHLAARLRRYCHPGTLMFSIFSTLKHIPEKPLHFRILDQERLIYEGDTNILRTSPQYQQTDFNRLMPGFQVRHSFLMRNGVKEFIFAAG